MGDVETKFPHRKKILYLPTSTIIVINLLKILIYIK